MISERRVFQNEFKRRRRLLVKNGVYHVMSRTACKSPLFGSKEKEVFCSIMAKQAAFSGVEILTYCIMDNHFHLLIRVKEPSKLLTDDEILRRYAKLYHESEIPQSTYSLPELQKALTEGNSKEAENARSKVCARMGNLPAFMRELKQRFTIWYNAHHNNAGTIWASRFKSLLVEDTPENVSTVAAYIDLNPIRAEVVEDPADYRWSGYAAAIGGIKTAKHGLVSIFGSINTPFDKALGDYRLILFGKGNTSKGLMNKDFGRISANKVQEVVKTGGALSKHELLRMRIRYMNDGMALGSKEFMEALFNQHRCYFGSKRKSGAHLLLAGLLGNLHVLRNLQKDPLGPPQNNSC